MNDVHGKYSAMTVNERLSTANLLTAFDSAINAEDRERAIEILLQVEMDERGAISTVDTVLANPSKYGYPRFG